ncbi:MAG: hypothetical protein Q4B42_04150 [Oscillospiraceae bacterium]|nr:hypothetical protein [Oscillospiraceae bacterium]
MKKKLCLTLAIICLFTLALSACSGGAASAGDAEPAASAAESGSEELVSYDTGLGLTIKMKAGMERDEVEGLSVFYSADDCMMSGIRETFEDFSAVGLDGAATTLEEYAELVKQANALENDFETGPGGKPFITYTRNINGDDFFYYTMLLKGSDAFWTISFASLDSEQGEFLPQFEAWSASAEAA